MGGKIGDSNTDGETIERSPRVAVKFQNNLFLTVPRVLDEIAVDTGSEKGETREGVL